MKELPSLVVKENSTKIIKHRIDRVLKMLIAPVHRLVKHGLSKNGHIFCSVANCQYVLNLKYSLDSTSKNSS